MKLLIMKEDDIIISEEALKEKKYTKKRFLDRYEPKGLSTFSREVISKGSRDGMKKARAEHRWQNRPPDGFILDSNKKLLPNERTPLIRLIFAKYDEIENTAQIAFDLDKQGIKTKNGKKWTALEIYRLLKNPIYKGIYKSKETEAYVPKYQIVDTKLFDRVQKKLKKRGVRKEMSMERKEAKIDEVFEPYFEKLKTLKIPTERAIEFKPEIDKESLFYPREDEPVLTRMEKIRLRLLIHLEEICRLLEEDEVLDKQSTDNIKQITDELDELFKKKFLKHPEKRKIIQESLEDERKRIKQFAIEKRQFLDDVVR